MGAGKYHATLLILIFTLEQWLKNTFYHKEHILSITKYPNEEAKKTSSYERYI